MGIGRLLKLSSRNPGPMNRAHSLADSTAVTFSMAPTCGQPGTAWKKTRRGRIREVHDPEPPDDGPGVGVVVVEEVAERVRRAVQNVLQSHVLIDEGLGDVGQPGNLLAGLVAGSGDESLHLADRGRQIGQRRVQLGSAVVDHAGERGQPVVELHDLDVAVAQRGDEGLQILDDVDDVAAAVGEDPPHP